MNILFFVVVFVIVANGFVSFFIFKNIFFNISL